MKLLCFLAIGLIVSLSAISGNTHSRIANSSTQSTEKKVSLKDQITEEGKHQAHYKFTH